MMNGVGHDKPLYSKKLHILVLRARTNCETSLMIFAFSFGDSVVNHFASLCGSLSYILLREGARRRIRTTLPCRDSRIR